MYKNDKKWTHKGWMFGLVPICIRFDSEIPEVECRRFVPEWWFDLCESVYGFMIMCATMVNPEFEPQFAILVTGEIDDDSRGVGGN